MNIMSLEQSIAANTEANTLLAATIRDLIEALGSLPVAAHVEAPKRTRRSKAEIAAEARVPIEPTVTLDVVDQPALDGDLTNGDIVQQVAAAARITAHAPVEEIAEKAEAVAEKAEVVAAVAAVAAIVEADLDYNKDVRPLLLQAVERPDIGMGKISALFATYGVTHGKDLNPQQLPLALEAITKLLATAAPSAVESLV